MSEINTPGNSGNSNGDSKAPAARSSGITEPAPTAATSGGSCGSQTAVSACACCQALDLIRTRQFPGHISQPQTMGDFAPPQSIGPGGSGVAAPLAPPYIVPTQTPAPTNTTPKKSFLAAFGSSTARTNETRSENRGTNGSAQPKDARRRLSLQSLGDLLGGRKSSSDAETQDDSSWAEDDSEWSEKILDKRKPPRPWHGIEGLAVCLMGVALPVVIMLGALASMPKRLTLVTLNHPLETLAELLLIGSVPLVNFLVWSNLRKQNTQLSLKRGIALGAAFGTSAIMSGIAIAGMFHDNSSLSADIGSDFVAGFAWMALLYLMSALASAYIIFKIRQTRDFAKSKALVLSYAAVGAVLALFTFLGAEQRAWSVRLAEKMAVSGNKTESDEGMKWLRSLEPERELRMGCSDDRAAGLSGLFIPLKSSVQERLYFSLTGLPYSYRNEKNNDFAQMSDEYLNKNVVGAKISGLSLTRSSMSGVLHPRTLTSTINWTFVFKNDSSSSQEPRAEMGLPVGAVVTNLSIWHDGMKRDWARGTTENDRASDSSDFNLTATLTNLGRGRVLMQCHPVESDKQLEVQVTMAVPLKADGAQRCTFVGPKFIATNFDIAGDHQLRLTSTESLSSTNPNFKSERPAEQDFILSGTMTARQLENSEFEISTQRLADQKPLYVKDVIATRLRREQAKAREIARLNAQQSEDNLKEVVVMIDGSKGVEGQLQGVRNALARNNANNKKPLPKIKMVKSIYLVQTVKQLAARAPKKLMVVVDGSSTTGSYQWQIAEALKQIPSAVPTQVVIAAQRADEKTKFLSLAEGINALKNEKFVGGKQNLNSVVDAAQTAGDVSGGAVLWIHGPQPIMDDNIYIVRKYLSHPNFYELPLDSGDMDIYAYFKNHADIGPFSQVPRTGTVENDLGNFFARWKGDIKDYAPEEQTCDIVPGDAVPMTADEGKEVTAISLNNRCTELIANRRKSEASGLSERYRLVTPARSATLSTGEEAEEKSAAYVTGVNTAGTVRVNNLANLEALLNIIANLGEVAGIICGIILIVHGLCLKDTLTEVLGMPVEIGSSMRIVGGIALIVLGLAVPGVVNWFVASARDANLFS